jgi:serine acetyltransferase
MSGWRWRDRLSGVTISQNTVVGAGAIVVRDLPQMSSPSGIRPESSLSKDDGGMSISKIR